MKPSPERRIRIGPRLKGRESRVCVVRTIVVELDFRHLEFSSSEREELAQRRAPVSNQGGAFVRLVRREFIAKNAQERRGADRCESVGIGGVAVRIGASAASISVATPEISAVRRPSERKSLQPVLIFLGDEIIVARLNFAQYRVEISRCSVVRMDLELAGRRSLLLWVQGSRREEPKRLGKNASEPP